MPILENENPLLFASKSKRLGWNLANTGDSWDGSRQPIDSAEVFEHLRDIQDPEHPHSLETLGVVSESTVHVDDASGLVEVAYSPTIPSCSMATLIGLAIKVKLLRSLPRRFRCRVVIAEGSHNTAEEINKQLADKERVAAALENPALLKLVNSCLVETNYLSSSADQEEETYLQCDSEDEHANTPLFTECFAAVD